MTNLQKAKIGSLAKRMNQRLRELEKQGLAQASNWYKYIERDAYDNKSYLTRTKDGKIKFRTDITKMKPQTLRSLIRKLEESEKAKTSTVKGIKRAYKKGFEKFKETAKEDEEAAENINYEDFTEFWRDHRFKEAIRNFGYSETMNLIGEALANGISYDDILDELVSTITVKSVKEWIKRHSNRNKKSPDVEDDYEDTHNEPDEDDFREINYDDVIDIF